MPTATEMPTERTRLFGVTMVGMSANQVTAAGMAGATAAVVVAAGTECLVHRPHWRHNASPNHSLFDSNPGMMH